MTSYEMAQLIVKTLDEKKATDICVLEIGNVTSLGDYFVIASGGSSAQVKGLCGEIEDRLTKQGVEPKRVEGESTASWVLMDYYDVIVHIFNEETRGFYGLERLWVDAKKLDIEEILNS